MARPDRRRRGLAASSDGAAGSGTPARSEGAIGIGGIGDLGGIGGAGCGYRWTGVHEGVRQPVDHHVDAGIELQRGFHDDARLAPVPAQQLVHQEEGVARPGVTGKHDHRPGQPGRLFLRGGFGLLDLHLQPENRDGAPEQGGQEPANQRVVAVHRGFAAQPAAEPAGDPQTQTRHQRQRLHHQPRQCEPDQPQGAPPARPRRARDQSDEQEQRGQHHGGDRDEDDERAEYQPAENAGREQGATSGDGAGQDGTGPRRGNGVRTAEVLGPAERDDDTWSAEAAAWTAEVLGPAEAAAWTAAGRPGRPRWRRRRDRCRSAPGSGRGSGVGPDRPPYLRPRPAARAR